MPYEFRCEVCNAPSVAQRSTSKYCKPCGALKILEYTRLKFKRPRKCRTCGASFRPQKATDLAYCGSCVTRQLGDIEGPECALCRRPVPRKSILPTVCLVCLKDPVKQDKIVKLLAKQQTERIVEHRATMEE